MTTFSKTGNEQYLLIAIRGQHHQIAAGPSVIGIICAKRSELSKQPQWRGFEFQVRTPAGYAKVPILIKAARTKKVRVSSGKKVPTWQPYKD